MAECPYTTTITPGYNCSRRCRGFQCRHRDEQDQDRNIVRTPTNKQRKPTPAQVLVREQARAKREAIELAMVQQIRALGLHEGCIREHRFHEKRMWRFDFAWPERKVALEVDGATWSGGRHVNGDGYERDCEKQAEAVLAGWRMFRATAAQVHNGTAAFWIEQLVKAQ